MSLDIVLVTDHDSFQFKVPYLLNVLLDSKPIAESEGLAPELRNKQSDFQVAAEKRAHLPNLLKKNRLILTSSGDFLLTVCS